MGRAKRKKHPCPHCGKTFRGLKGFQYHIDEYVCRQSEKPGGPVIKGKRKVIEIIEDDEHDDTNTAVVVTENNDRQSERSGGLPVRGKRKVRKIENDDTDAVSENNDKEELEQADDEEPITKAITIKSTTKKQHNKIRGSLKDRTCPICKNVFTSIFGKTYHFSKYIYFYIIHYS